MVKRKFAGGVNALIKEPYMDYITAAMQLYAAEGKPSLEELKRESVYPASTYLDLECVARMLHVLQLCDTRGRLVTRSVELVYFKPPFRQLKKEDIANRVKVAAAELNVDERNVYRYLKMARGIAAKYRGLRL